jgi:hypothetical protein
VRYYSLTLSQPNGDSIVQDGTGGFTTGSGPTFTSLVNGRTDPGALNIEFDFPGYALSTSQGAQRIKIWGVGLRSLSQASNLAGMNFSLKAGMANGLPLANSVQAGLILQGKVFQSYGNWQGVNQTLDLIVNPGLPGVLDSLFDIQIPFWWPAGTPLNEVLSNALGQLFQGFKTQVEILEDVTLANDEAGYYDNIFQFASYLKGITVMQGSQRVLNYPGVDITWNGDVIRAFDGTQNVSGPYGQGVALDFQDLIGQPTWLTGTTVSFQTVLRADISIGNTVTFPKGILTPYALTSPAAAVPNVPASSRSIFQGSFIVNEVHHYGNFRDPDADSWCTAFVCTSPPVPR